MPTALYGLLVLPESLPAERRSPFRWKSANPLGALHLLRSNRVLAGLSMANFFAQLAHVVLPSTYVLYATYRYGWDTTTVGVTLAMVGVCSMVVQGAGIGPIVKRFGEKRALLFGLLCGAIGFLIFAAAPTGPLSWLGIPVMALWGVAGAAIQALMTRLVAPDQQGQLQGATSSVQSLVAARRPVPVHADVCLLHRCDGAVQIARRAVLPGVGAVAAGGLDRAADAGEEIVGWVSEA